MNLQCWPNAFSLFLWLAVSQLRECVSKQQLHNDKYRSVKATEAVCFDFRSIIAFILTLFRFYKFINVHDYTQCSIHNLTDFNAIYCHSFWFFLLFYQQFLFIPYVIKDHTNERAVKCHNNFCLWYRADWIKMTQCKWNELFANPFRKKKHKAILK